MRQSRLRKIIVINTLIMLAIVCITWQTTLLINKSVSIPGKIFLLVKSKHFHKGDLVGITDFQPNYTGERHYTKRLSGIPGDIITVADRRVYLNGELQGVAKAMTKELEPLTPIEAQIIPLGKYFVMTEHEDSFDSRYAEFGLVEAKNIEGRVYRIW